MPRFWGTLASGVLPVAKDTCRVLLQKRSPYVYEGGTWGIVGGAIDSIFEDCGGGCEPAPSTERDFDFFARPENAKRKEQALQESARREFAEESGSPFPVGKMERVFLFKASPPAKFEYHDYVGEVEREFDPEPGDESKWESSGHAWVPIPQLIESAERGSFRGVSFHPGLRAALVDPDAKQKLMRRHETCKIT